MEKATTNSLRREAEELGLRAGRKVDVIDSIDGEENERRRKRSGVVVRLFQHRASSCGMLRSTTVRPL